MNKKIIRKFRYNLRKLERIVEVMLRIDTCCHGVSVAQCHTLLAIELLQEPSLNELAEEMDLDKSTLSRTVETLVKNGLLERAVDSDDRRITRITLTPAGQEVCNGINRDNDARYASVLAAIDRDAGEIVEDFAELVAAMASIKTNRVQCKTNQSGERNDGD